MGVNASFLLDNMMTLLSSQIHHHLSGFGNKSSTSDILKWANRMLDDVEINQSMNGLNETKHLRLLSWNINSVNEYIDSLIPLLIILFIYLFNWLWNKWSDIHRSLNCHPYNYFKLLHKMLQYSRGYINDELVLYSL